MRVRDLEYLYALARYKHFQKAADACNVSQPTLSAQVRKLESDLGITLINRQVRGVKFTAQGIEALSQIEVILSEVKSLKHMAEESKKHPSGVLNIGSVPTLAPYIFGDIEMICRERFPKTEFKFHEASKEKLVALLDHDIIQVAIITSPINNDDVVEFPVFEEPYVIGLSTKHPSVSNDKFKLPLPQNEKIMITESLFAEALDDTFAQTVLSATKIMPNTLETARYIVTHSQNVSFFPLLSSIDEKVKNIRYLRTHPEELRRRVVMICRRGDPFRRRFEQLRGDLSAAFSRKITGKLQ
ncbi:LysR family transcriptional regulator [Kosakonia oryzendophytica]|uniref:LysR family transcriptional regulator n=1 Tax=Kosakonia oryzendophytica TaxID=1005665 RepID=UPI003D356E4C